LSGKVESKPKLSGNGNECKPLIVGDALFGADVQGQMAKEINSAIQEAFEHFGRHEQTALATPSTT
jgi:NAD(P)H-hydrate repair Nnr-like enzyme with NAD(P)H-hydrate epimerase domain